MLARGRVYVVAAVVLGLACALLIVVWRGGSPDVGPAGSGRGRVAPAPTTPAPPNPPPTSPASTTPAPITPVGGSVASEPATAVIASGASASTTEPEPVNSEPDPAAETEGVLARLVDRVGGALPHVPVTVRTVSPPHQVLTGRNARTDHAGHFRFRAPGRPCELNLWCPRFAISIRQTWRPEHAFEVTEFRLDRTAVVGRLVAADGQPPRWSGIHLRLSLVPTGGSGGGSIPVAFVPRTGAFTALADADRDVDLEVTALGDTGHRRLALVPRVNRSPLPLTVTVASPEAYFGGVELALTGLPALDGAPRLDAVSDTGRRRLALTVVAGNRYRVGPLAPRSYLVRVVAGGRVSAWRRAAVESGRTLDLGSLALARVGRLRVRPLGSDGATLRGVRISLIDRSSGKVPVRFEEDALGLLATDVSPGHYQVSADPPRYGSDATSRPAVSRTTVEVRPGGVHEVVIRLP